MNDITFEQYLGGDPIQILKAAQEKLRLEEEEKKRIAEVEQMKAYRAAALKRAAEEDPLGAAQQMLGQTRGNDPLQQVMQRAAQRTPLDDMAQVSPQEIERQMRERIWGAPAKSKIGKVGKGISDFLGAFSGLPTDFSKPAMEQFLKIQEQYRKERANDLTAMTQAAQITGRENTNKDKLLLDVFKTKHKGPLDFMKAIDSAIKTDAYVDQVNNMDKYLAGKNENEKQRLILEAKKIAADISNEMEYGLRMAELVKTNPQMAALVRANYIDAMQQKAGMNAASKSGGARTSTTQGFSKDTTIDPATGNKIVQYTPQPPRTTTSGPGPNPVGDAFMAQNPFAQFMSGQGQMPLPAGAGQPIPQAAPKGTGFTPPKASVERVVPTDNPITQKAPGTGESGYKLVEIKRINPPGMSSIDLGAPGTQATNDKVRVRVNKAAQLADAANIVIDAYTNGVAQRVHGALAQPISALERIKSAANTLKGKTSEESANFETASKDINSLINRFKGDPAAQRYLQSIQMLDTMKLADYIKEISGAQAATSEAARLSTIFPKLSDPPEIVLQKSIELMMRVGTLEALNAANLSPNELAATSRTREELRQERLNKLLNNVRSAYLQKQAGRDVKGLLPGPADFDFNSLLAETEERSGIKFKNILFQNYTPKKKVSSRGKLMETGGRPGLAPEEDQDEILNNLLKKAKGRK